MSEIALAPPLSRDSNELLTHMSDMINGVPEEYTVRGVMFLDLAQATRVGAEVYFDLLHASPPPDA